MTTNQDDPAADPDPAAVERAAAVAVLYAEHRRSVHRYLRSRVRDDGLADDLASEVFVRALRRRTAVPPADEALPWLFTIAKNLVVDHYRSARHRREVTTAAFDDVVGDAAGPEQQLLRRDARDSLLRWVAGLGAEQRRCVEMRFLLGMSVDETAAAMCRGTGAVKSLQSRALVSLARLSRLDERG
ncbi:RNA polymerase sigma factor [Actinokineospora bangkokensis]|uniref:RNA polymerase subunit sigma-70 n=1 Tax=Actinokineospora bangkokensis TaxID=1193682 RepID=A0A1Q9LMN1_9PSEU|nr:RNA polymerase sigma factor [Actinokineospora bangkokensis]OLR93263.1 hypothetical protein BJP25_17420 [Actinokineospora bangkokensis]